MAKKESRFFKKELEKSLMTTTELWIDRETGVNYLYYIDGTVSGNGGGLTVFFGKDGKPVITPPEELAKLEQE